MHFRPILLHKGLNPKNGVVPEARTNPNVTVKALQANVAVESTPTGLWPLVAESRHHASGNSRCRRGTGVHIMPFAKEAE